MSKKETGEVQFKLTLKTGKVVILKDLQVGDQEQAAEAARLTQGMSSVVQAMKMQQELIKGLIVSINGKAPSALERESLKTILTIQEFGQIASFVGELTGEGEKPTVEVIT
jgi:hypothetical protein